MFDSGMMLQFIFTFVLFLCLSFVHGQDEIRLVRMRVSGTTMTTRNGRNISAYLGIPYAEPPIGPLRFSNTRPWMKYGEVLAAVKDGNECPQFNKDGVLVGDEDCLYLNVYTPNPRPEDDLYPVMVYFHGGNFFTQGSGSSTNAGPEYLLDKDIVLVTVNYRLGVLGFLSTGDASAPGNFGLKDQALALQWIRENIADFGGNPIRVTIFGQDAGGASTTLHAIFNPSKDFFLSSPQEEVGKLKLVRSTSQPPYTRYLFEQYISQSGNALAFWAFQEINTYSQRAFDLGKSLNCPTSNSQVLVKCLRNADAYDLVDSNNIFNDAKWVLHTWGPTLEAKELEGAFMTEIPIWQIVRRGIKDCPAILGNVFDEGLLWAAAFYTDDTLYNSMKEDLFDYLNYVIKIFFDGTSPYRLTRETQHFYFNDSQTTDKKTFTQNLANFLSDAAFRVSFDIQLRTLPFGKVTTPFYVYAFDYRGTFSKTSLTLGNNDNIGVTHGDDLIYLFPTKTSNITLNESDNKMIDIMVDFWTSFAYTGTPTSEHISDPNVWKPYVAFDEDDELLKIGDNSDPMDIKGYPQGDQRLEFWAVQLGNQISG